MHLFTIAGALIFGYILGSIPFGYILTKISGHGDIRKVGSGNVGATNVLRAAGKLVAFLTFVCDALKGTGAVLGAQNYLNGDETIALFAAAGVIFGHMFPCWLKFKGGKGVATAFGSFAAIAPFIAAIGGAIWLLIAALTRISSLASLLAFTTTAFMALFIGKFPTSVVLSVLSLVVLLKHKDNIVRLMHSREPRIKLK